MSAMDFQLETNARKGRQARAHAALPRSRVLPVSMPTWEAAALALMLIVVAVAHGWNMFHFPNYDSDEGTYTSQAYSLVKHGMLAPYTYWYDHAPAGWMFIGLWSAVTGGFDAFGFSINSGRVLMLVLHLASSVLLFFIVRRTTARPFAAFVAVAIFSFAGQGIFFQRRVLLDNIAVFWLFVSIALLVMARGRLSRLALSGFFLGLAMLTKETMAFLAPVLFFASMSAVPRGRRALAGVLFAGATGTLLACYAIYAALKGELFPSGSLLGGDWPHVSLLGTLQWQASRPAGPFTNIHVYLAQWFADDPVWLSLGVALTIGIVVLAIRQPKARLSAGLIVAFWLYLLRGGVILNFYIVPLYALVGLVAGVFVGLVLPSPLPRGDVARGRMLATGAVGIVCVIVWIPLAGADQVRRGLLSGDETRAQTQAVDWLLSRVDARVVAVDDFASVDLREGVSNSNLRPEWYWKLDRDPEVQLKSTGGNPETIDYLLVTPQMTWDLQGLPFTRAAYALSRRIESFESDGYRVEIWANMAPRRLLNASWYSYVASDVDSGRVIDGQENDSTLAYQQASALFRAVQSDDRAAFDSLWNWAAENLEHKGLWLSQWKEAPSNSGDANASDPASTVDAALALALAGRRWDEPAYTRAAGELADSVWSRAVVHTGLGPVVTSDALVPSRSGYAAVAPTTINPAAYRELARIDSAHDWKAVLDASYRVVGACSTQGYPARLCGIGLASGVGHALTLPSEMSNDLRTAELGSRLAMDHQWSGDVRDVVAARHLQSLVADWKRRGRLAAEYGPSGNRVRAFESATAYGGYMGAVALLEPSQLKAVYERGLKSQFFDDGSLSYWQDPKNGAAQNAGWLGTAVYAGSLSDFR